MFYKHTIIKKDKKEELILFVNLYYEFGSFNNKKKYSIKESIRKYINDNNIKFNGEKVLVAAGGVLLATFIITNQEVVFSDFNEESIITYVEESSVKKLKVIPPAENKIIEEKKINSNDTTKKKINSTKLQVQNKDSKKTTVTKKNTNKTSSKKTIINKKSDTSKSTKTTTAKKDATVKNVEKVTIYRANGKVETLILEDYVIGVVAAEMPAAFNIEALKAQAIIARTYALKSKSTSKKLTDTVSTQSYIDTSQMKSKWGSDYSKYYNKIKNAVNTTTGMYITYNNQIIDAVYHSTSNGYTEDAIEVWGHSIPYLKSVSSSWDKTTSGFKKTITKDSALVLKTFGIDSLEEISILKRNSSGRVSEVKVGNSTYSGVDIREILSLRSADFDLKIENGNLVITTRGYGHGVGMSQYGANGMANAGKNYTQIIRHYYTGVKIQKK